MRHLDTILFVLAIAAITTIAAARIISLTLAHSQNECVQKATTTEDIKACIRATNRALP